MNQHIDHVVQRAAAFYLKTQPGHYLLSTHFPVEAPSIPPLFEFDLNRQRTDWLDARLGQERAIWRAKEGLDDDSIPAISPFFGIAEHSAWLGMDVLLQEDTCLPIPILLEPEDLSRLRLNQEDRWFGFMKTGYEYLRSQQDGTFLLSVRGTMSPMDIANAVCGDRLFLDFKLQPDFIHKLLCFLVAAMLCSPAVYAEFGFPYEKEVVKGYNYVFYHVHNQKMHFLSRLVELPSLALLEVTNDPRTPPAVEDLERTLDATGSANLMLAMTSEQVRSHLDDLDSRNVFLRVECLDRCDADDVIAFVRDRSKELM